MTYRADIDGIRAIAVLLVVVFHFDLVAFGQAGFIGVDLFFVISGYLISGIIWRDLEAGRFSLAHFYARRIRRLAPALLAVQALVLAAGVLLLLPDELRSLARETIAAQAYVSNLYYWKTLDYFGLHADHAFLLHTWSLGVEEQFYLFYPLFLMAVHRWARRWFWPILAATTLASFALNLVVTAMRPATAFYLLPTRAWELGVGALLPLAEPWFARRPGARAVAAPLGLLVLVAALLVHGPDTPFPGWFALMPVAAGAGLLLGGSGGGGPMSRALSIAPVTFFGRISYPFYLVHWPLHVFALTVLPSYGPGWRWGMFVVAIGLAWGITALEAPIRERRWLRETRPLVAAYATTLAVVIAIAGLLIASGGWPARFSPTVRRIAGVASHDGEPARRGEFGRGGTIATHADPIGAVSAAPTWLIYGDSHAQALAPAIARWLAKRGEAGELVYRSSCMPLLDVGNADCRDLNRQAVRYAAGRSVLLVAVWREPLDVGYRGRDGRVLTGPAAVADAQAAIARTVAALRAAGARVHVWEPLPTAARAVPAAMARAALFGSHWPVVRTLASHRQEMGWVAAAFDRAGVPAADRVDPAPAVCPDGTCGFVLNGLPLYSDTNHPARHSVAWFARVLDARARFAPAQPIRERP